MKDWNIALGFYQNLPIAEAVLKRLQKEGLKSCASIHKSHQGRITIKQYFPKKYTIISFATLLFITFSFLFFEHGITSLILTTILAVLAAIAGEKLFFPFRIAPQIIEQFKPWVLYDETLIIVQIKPQEISQSLAILRKVESWHPVSFLLRMRAKKNYIQLNNDELIKEPLTAEQMHEKACQLALELKDIERKKTSRQPLLNELAKSKKILQEVRFNIAAAEHIEQSITSSAEWLLDNNHIIQGSIEEVRRNLPQKFYQDLPKLCQGSTKGLPRIYIICKDIISNTANQITREKLLAYLTSFQSEEELTIGELWALPLMLRLRLIECLRDLVIGLDHRLNEGEYASFWGNRLLNVARHDASQIPVFLQGLYREYPLPPAHFSEELIDHLFDEQAVLLPVTKWIEESLHLPIADIVKKEQLRNAAEQIAFSNAIVSLITLSQLSWTEIFEAINPVDALLNKDPSGVYGQMDFTTQDRYRQQIEKLARPLGCRESSIANAALELCQTAPPTIGGIKQHIGYYLIDKGLPLLEEKIGCKLSFYEIQKRRLKKFSPLLYLLSVGLLTLTFESIFFVSSYHWMGMSIGSSLLLTVLALLPISECTIQGLNILLSKLVPPYVLPKMAYKKSIPQELKTLVIIPTMLTSSEDIESIINKLEIHYLANSDASLRFGVYVDFLDAPLQHMDEDQGLIETTKSKMLSLVEAYGAHFFLFSRERVWSESEQAWIGWERKRGKLESLNRFLIDPKDSKTLLLFGEKAELNEIRYVITLDSDTQLPKDSAKQLVETISHPLNRAQWSERKIIRGYAIIQPRIANQFMNAKQTWFSHLFSDISSANPYTQAVSEIYQDLMCEGTYHGKGIYDLHAFHELLSGIFPEERLLSHDLIEGCYVKVGYASDITLLDSFPENYLIFQKRLERWIRGDWQIFDWLFHKVPTADGKNMVNPLTAINRWKIFDNLRRSLLPVASLSLLLYSWFATASPIFGTLLVTIVYLLPLISRLFLNLFTNICFYRLFIEELTSGILRIIINMALLPNDAMLSLTAITRSFFRRYISHRHLLEWAPSHVTNRALQTKMFYKVFAISLASAVVSLVIFLVQPAAFALALPFCILWMLSPLITYALNLSYHRERHLSSQDLLFLRQIARRTWRFFEDFISPQTNWLPPDNYQSALLVEVAMRTSPTNIGLSLLSILAAYDLKYISGDEVLIRVAATLETIKKLEKHDGHLLNWYDIQNLQPLFPRYVSTVDSGNFLASLWTLEQGIEELILAPLLPKNVTEGLRDTFSLIFQVKDRENLKTPLKSLKMTLQKDSSNLAEQLETIEIALKAIEEFLNTFPDNSCLYEIKQLEKELQGWQKIGIRYFSWVTPLFHCSTKGWQPNELAAYQMMVHSTISLQELALQPLPESFVLVLDKLRNTKEEHYEKIIAALHCAKEFAKERLTEAMQRLYDVRTIAEQHNMTFLYSRERKLFSIGYHVDDCKLDTSYYDLLASEARLASLLAIAKGDVPINHWWALGRPYNIVNGREILLSWGGTMFEYLMPLIFHPFYQESLLGSACDAAVCCQIRYGKKRGIPWGISESAYSAIDIRNIYQYRSFGVPGLGFKRGLEDDLVVSPYSSALALAVKPKAAIKNLRSLAAEEGNSSLLSDYGFYEALDFSRQKTPQGKRGVIIYAFMAHHQAMSFLSFNNILNNNIMTKRFHSNPYVAGVESLLYERIPINPPIVKGSQRHTAIGHLTSFSTVPIMGIVETPHTTLPKVNLLSNGEYSLMITNSGAGYSRWKDFDITRWRADTTSDNWGSFLYLKDIKKKNFWSAGYHPCGEHGSQYFVSFKADKAEIRRRCYQIESVMELFVSPEDNAEVRLITVGNLSKYERTIELTSYCELALAPHATDLSHPAFNKLFIETEILSEFHGILAFRRSRSPQEMPLYAIHVVACQDTSLYPVESETDRAIFLGRAHTLAHPAAMDKPLSNSCGTTLDPIFSLRYTLRLLPGQRIKIAFITAAASSREKAITLIKKYTEFSASQRAMEIAWSHAQLLLRHLRIHQEEAQLFQKFASRIIYPHAQLRPSNERLTRNKLGQKALWPYGISGDLPIVVLSIADIHEISLVKQTLLAHAFWQLRGLKTDLVILNEEATSYSHTLYEQLQRLIHAHTNYINSESTGKIFLLNWDQMPADDILVILASARVHLIAARGNLRQQLVSPVHSPKPGGQLTINRQIKEESSKPLPFLQLSHFNGLGGFTCDGKEYVINLETYDNTPAPWVNIIANPQFGTIVTESGLGCSWYGNSQTNRLTPWSNDALVNPMSDVIYLRDEISGTFWTITAGPIREKGSYRIHHGQGYSRFERHSHGLLQDLLIFVPVDEQGGKALRIQRLQIKNTSNKKRCLCLFSYNEWVLGTEKEVTQAHVITEWDIESQSLFAYNRYNPDYSSSLAFACCNPIPIAYSGNRAEFLGRNRPLNNPLALKRQKLSDTTGAAFDPCAALQIKIELAPGEQKEIIFAIGSAQDPKEARELITLCRTPDKVEELFLQTIGWWEKFLCKIQFDIPEAPAVNFACNRWLLYQTLSCRFWARTAFYQSSGAFGFRDQLQDALALLFAAPQLARTHILEAAARQFIEGDVQHWWHPPTGGGVRTRISDDLLWLPFVVAHYVRVTQDHSILEENIPFICGELLKEGEHEAYFIPEISKESATLLEHCRRAINKGTTAGPHGLPLIGGGDWNDGMNLVGIQGKGESVWLAWFLIHVMADFTYLLQCRGKTASSEGFLAQSRRLAEAVESSSWDGEWYLRAYFDDGTPLGSRKNSEKNAEDIIDSLPQSWAAISAAADPQRTKQAMQSVEKYLIKEKQKLLLLLTPPFDKTELNPGYIKGYPPGVRENGGQYTHGSLWVPMAFARLGEGEKAVKLLQLMLPSHNIHTKEQVNNYKIEPFVLAGDVYALSSAQGRGGWSWYTGSASWMYRIWLEEIVGFTLRGAVLSLKPCLPKDWKQIKIVYTYHTSPYEIVIENPERLESGKVALELDGISIEGKEISLIDDGKKHIIKARITT